jgi:hypothetical protein
VAGTVTGNVLRPVGSFVSDTQATAGQTGSDLILSFPRSTPKKRHPTSTGVPVLLSIVIVPDIEPPAVIVSEGRSRWTTIVPAPEGSVVGDGFGRGARVVGALELCRVALLQADNKRTSVSASRFMSHETFWLCGSVPVST